MAFLVMILVLASSRANLPTLPSTTNAAGVSSCASQASAGPWLPRSAAQASASALVTAAAVNALRESGSLPASKGSSSASSSAASSHQATKKGKKKKKSTKPDKQQPQQRPVLPSSLNGLAALALDGDGGDVEATNSAGGLGENAPLPRATVIVPLQSEREARAAAATALSAAAAFEQDEGDDGSSSSSSLLEIIIVAADAEVARSLSGTSAEAQEGVRLVVRDAAAARIAGQKQRGAENDGGGEENGGDDEKETSSSSSSSGRPFLLLRRSPLPPLLPPRSPQLGGGGAGDAALRNAGARAARSEDLLVFLKPGVILRGGYWRSVLSAAEANPRAQLFFTGRRASPTLPQAEESDGEWARRLPWHNPYAFNRAFALRRSAWVEAGGFSPAAAPGVDVEALLLSALDAPPRVERVDAKGDLVKEEGAGPSGKGTIASTGVRSFFFFSFSFSLEVERSRKKKLKNHFSLLFSSLLPDSFPETFQKKKTIRSPTATSSPSRPRSGGSPASTESATRTFPTTMKTGTPGPTRTTRPRARARPPPRCSRRRSRSSPRTTRCRRSILSGRTRSWRTGSAARGTAAGTATNPSHETSSAPRRCSRPRAARSPRAATCFRGSCTRSRAAGTRPAGPSSAPLPAPPPRRRASRRWRGRRGT